MPGALIISLDFEIHWGLLYSPFTEQFRQHLLGVPGSVRGMLALFHEMEIAATWATVGLLFARDREEQRRFWPAVRPRYDNAALDPYCLEDIGSGEVEDPLHYAPTLITEIASTPLQEIATHTFSHFFCAEARGNIQEAFRADLEGANRIMVETCGIKPRSIVFPRNQHNPALDDILVETGIPCYRGNPRSWLWPSPGSSARIAAARAGRLVDSYLPLSGDNLFRHEDVARRNGTFNVPASFFLRPLASRMQVLRLESSLRRAAERGQVLHLWWHPHNFASRTEENLCVLRHLLEVFCEMRDKHGMESLSMYDLACQCGMSA
jgi:hypothetical protein